MRVRILAVFVGQFALMFLLVGTITTFTLHRFQVEQLDERLSAAGQRFNDKPPGRDTDTTQNRDQQTPGDGETTPSDVPDEVNVDETENELFSSIQSPQTLAAQIIDGEVVIAGILEDSGEMTELTEEQEAILSELPTDQQKYTRDLGEIGDYRLVANPIRTNEVLVTGLPMDEVEATEYKLIAIEVVVGLAALLIATIAGAAVIRMALAPLTRVAATAKRVSAMPLHEGEVGPLMRVPKADTDPRSEAGQVGAAFNRMMDHIGAALSARQASETRLRRFAADASHELRTPLAAIRGYTELTRRHRATTPAPVADALDRVEAATRRMTTLVEDLLLLARLDAKRPLAREPVDLSAMVIEAITDAHVAGPGHRWLLDLPEESVGVVGDQSRLHQVVANLLTNARTHTPAGTTVTVGLTTLGDYAAIRVMDDGPGISPQLMPRLFERFARGDSSRSRATGSTGLGLAIVNAVVEAHGGRVDVASVPGNTSFIIWLPLLDTRGQGPPGGIRPSRPHDPSASG